MGPCLIRGIRIQVSTTWPVHTARLYSDVIRQEPESLNKTEKKDAFDYRQWGCSALTFLSPSSSFLIPKSHFLPLQAPLGIVISRSPSRFFALRVISFTLALFAPWQDQSFKRLLICIFIFLFSFRNAYVSVCFSLITLLSHHFIFPSSLSISFLPSAIFYHMQLPCWLRLPCPPR